MRHVNFSEAVFYFPELEHFSTGDDKGKYMQIYRVVITQSMMEN